MTATETTDLTLHRGGLDREQVELLKRTICEDATEDEFKMFVGICKRTGLDPFSKQIYFRKYNTNKGPRVTIITGIDGYRLMAQRTGEYEGQRGPEWCGKDGQWVDVWLSSEFPVAARVGVWRTKFRDPVYAIAKWAEYFPSNPIEQFMWKKMPANQIAKCAEALALRKAFPHEMSNVYTAEEMAQADGEKPRGARAKDVEVVPADPLATKIQIARIHALKGEIGGMQADDHPKTRYRQFLHGYKRADGTGCEHSNELTEKQASHAIERMEGMKREQHARAEQAIAVVGAALEEPPPPTDDDAPADTGESATDEGYRAIADHLKRLRFKREDAQMWLRDLFHVEKVTAMTARQVDAAFVLLSGLKPGEDPTGNAIYQRCLADFRREGAVA